MKRILSFLFIFLIIFPCFILSVSAQNDGYDIDIPEESGAVYLYSYNGNRVLISNDSESKRAPASTAKMMTGLVVCRKYAYRLNERVTVTAEMIADLEGTSMGLKPGMTLTIEALLYGTVCGGNNDAAQALAIACAGDISSFVDEMNKYARHLDMRNTKYANPTGLDSKDASTTLFDTFKLASTAASDELYLSISSTLSYEIFTNSEAITIYNRNALISQFAAQGYINKNAKGLIAGSTDESGYVLATYAEKNGVAFLCIVMGATADANDIYSYSTANTLLDHAFLSYSQRKILTENTTLMNADVSLALNGKDQAYISCVPESDVYAFLANDISVDDLSYVTYLHEEKLNAPIKSGTVVGGVDIYYGDTYLASAKLISTSSVEANLLLYGLDVMRSFFLNRIFWITLVVAAALITVYIFNNKQSRRHQKVSTVQFKKFY